MTKGQIKLDAIYSVQCLFEDELQVLTNTLYDEIQYNLQSFGGLWFSPPNKRVAYVAL